MNTVFEVVVIDDNADDVSQFRMYLRQASSRQFRFTEAATGEAGLAICRRDGWRPGCVLLDLHLPDMDGIHVLKKLQDPEGFVPFPVVVLTGSGSEGGGARAALHAGAQDFIGKSWLTPEGLARAVENAVDRFALAVQLREQRRDLSRQKALFQALADNTPDIIARFGPELRHLYVNPAFERATGLPAAHFVGRTHRDLGTPEAQCDQWEAKLRQAFQVGDRLTFEFESDGATGSRVYECRLSPELGPDGGIVSVLATATDVTDRKKLEGALRTADRQKDEFLAMLGHELRNPLAPIRNAVVVLRESGQLPSKALPLVDLIGRQTDHLVRLVDDLLDVSRITSGKIALTRMPVAVADIVAGAVEAVRPLIVSRDHSLTLDIPPEAPWVEGDSTRLVQVVLNLLNNAAKYTDPGGHIEVSVRAEGEHVAIRVRDDGIGIPAYLLPRLFDLFTQADHTLDRAQGGLGLGLTLVRRLSEMHGGSVTASSGGAGCGSEFIIRLPTISPPPCSDSAEPECRQGSRRCRVLIVDDNRDAADSLATILEIRGHAVRTAYDGPSGLQSAVGYRPDIVLLDIGLPGMSGYEVAREMRRRMPDDVGLIIAVTGYGMEDVKRRCLEAGFDAHLTKPVDIAALSTLLDA